jgi:AcrR family transcriptional regulator
MESERPYHHGDLRRALVDTARAMLAEGAGEEELGVRALARRLGVAHSAPGYHFPDRASLLEAVAADGFERLAAAMSAAAARRRGRPDRALLAAGRAYVAFAVENRAQFALMFRPGILERPDAQRAAADAFAVLTDATRPLARTDRARRDLALASWSLVHGLATLAIHDVGAPSARRHLLAGIDAPAAAERLGARALVGFVAETATRSPVAASARAVRSAPARRRPRSASRDES